MTRLTRTAAVLRAHRGAIASLVAIVLATNVVVIIEHRSPRAGEARALGAAPAAGAVVDADGKPEALAAAGHGRGGRVADPTNARDVRNAPAGRVIPGKGTVPHGIDGNELTVVYYWKGDQTKSSPFLRGTGKEGNVDEGEAFRNLIAYINKHADGGELMGFRFNLHGWRLKPVVLEAGKGDDQIRAAQRIAEVIKPFAAVSSHGSISSYVCPRLAQARIFNLSTYDLDWDLRGRTNGYCLPQGLSYDAQVDVMTAYLASDARTTTGASGTGAKPVYGFVYAEYPGLIESAPETVRRLRAAGVNIPEGAVASVDPDLTTAGRQQPSVIAKFRSAGVNTIISPEAGSYMTFTHAAEAAGFQPSYTVWPCSGQDSLGMTRFYNASQWARASGLTCYDEWLNADLTNDDRARRTEWYKAYQTVAGRDAEPPAQTALVYQSLLPLVAGITYAGRDLTIERFTSGLAAMRPYRYHAIEGRTSNPTNLLVSIGSGDGSQIGDAGKIVWDPTARTPGNPTPGTYTFPEPRRYRPGTRF